MDYKDESLENLIDTLSRINQSIDYNVLMENTRKISDVFTNVGLTMETLGQCYNNLQINSKIVVNYSLVVKSFYDTLYSPEMKKIARNLANNASLISGVMNKYDYSKIVGVAQCVYNMQENIKEIENVNFVDNIACDYINDIIADCNDTEIHNKKINIKEYRDWIAAIVTIISFVLGLGSGVSLKIDNSFNTIVEVNNYYVTENNIDAQLLNQLSFCIINRDNVMPRERPNQSSRVVAHLSTGQVVRVSEKKKKWIEINWEDEDGNWHSGWIQNYKTTRFK